MRRKDIKVGLRVKPSGNGGTKYWRNLEQCGTVTRLHTLYVYIRWDDAIDERDEYPYRPIDLRSADEV